ncbi:MAG: hypothetical protein M9958_10280 [Chitinophagales bacterium]|nr:hypothetical protein [Chitinophagales bacterium]
MFLDFFFLLKNEGIPVSIQEYLSLLEALKKGIANYSVEDFYSLCKTILIKHEQYLDRFDVLFGHYFKGVQFISEAAQKEIPEDWLKKEMDRMFSEEEKKLIEAYGGLEEIMKRLEELLQEQKERHQGGNTWIGTGGTSSFGNGGFNPQGVRIGGAGGQKSAIKIWEKRQFRDYSDDLELNIRNIKMALRRLRILTRDGIQDELDMNTTIDKTCKNAGYIDIAMQASKKNRVKVLLFFDVGGSMDPHIEMCSQLFSAAKSEFKHLEFYYFHNCIYESVWKNNLLRWDEKTPTLDIFHKFNGDYKVIIVGDATMSPYELSHAGGSIEHHNDQSGITWLKKIKEHFPYTIWINPSAEAYWDGTRSIQMIQEIFPQRMFPMTVEGLSRAMKELKGKKLRV